MKKTNLIKYALLILVVIAFCVSIFIGFSKAGSSASLEDWIGSSVNVQRQKGSVVRTYEGVKLIAITDKGIIIKKGNTKIFIYDNAIYVIELNR